MPRKDTYNPDFKEFARVEEKALIAKLAAIRSSISHAGEKGRSLEIEVIKLLREFLPAAYGLSTGFVVWMSPLGPKLSQQLDIIIYDAVQYAPIVSLGSSDVFPLEAVYGYVEVKSTLRSSEAKKLPLDSVEMCIEQNKAIREMKNRRYIRPVGGSPIRFEAQNTDWLSIRSFIFAFEASGPVANDRESMAAAMRKKLMKVGNPAHIHGLYLGGVGYFATRAVDSSVAKPSDYFHIIHTQAHPLLAFKTALLKALRSFPQPHRDWTPAIDNYYELVSDWHEDTSDKEDDSIVDLGTF